MEEVKEIYIFSDSQGLEIPKSSYVTTPVWVKRVRPKILSKAIRIFYEPFQLLFYARKIKPSFINGIYCLPKGLNSYLVTRIVVTKCVNWVIGSRLEIETELPFRKIWEKINLWHLGGCDAISVKGQKDIDYLSSKGIDTKKIFILNGAIDFSRFRYSKGVRSIDMLFVGSFIELKGTDRVLQVLKKLLIYFPDITAVMVGNGKLLAQSKELAFKLGVGNNVKFEGYQKNIVPYYQNSKILLMPSRSEGLPTAMLEAMSCGCVPVISEVGNIKEIAIHNFNSKIIGDYNDINSFASQISDLLNQESKRNEFAIHARDMVENKYSVAAQSKIAEQLINSLYNGGESIYK